MSSDPWTKRKWAESWLFSAISWHAVRTTYSAVYGSLHWGSESSGTSGTS